MTDASTTKYNSDANDAFYNFDNMASLVTRAMPTEMQPCRLLELPAELREMIYTLALVHYDTIILRTIVNKRKSRTPRSLRPCNVLKELRRLHLSPNLLSTCSQIRNEATSILYGENRITFTGCGEPTTLAVFLEVTNESSKYLRDVMLNGEWYRRSSNKSITILEQASINMNLSKISLGPLHRRDFTPEQMALALRSLTRALDKRGNADTDKKTTHVLDMLEFPPYRIVSPVDVLDPSFDREERRYQRVENRKAAKYGNKVKSLLKIMLQE